MAVIVAFHAHPDDEAILTGGTLARAAAEGHRVVIVVAGDGLMGPRPPHEPPRMRELRTSAAVLGAARVVHLGYADSGHGPVLYPDPPDRPRFVRADPLEAAERLAAILREEKADLLLSYDPNGGYGHRDHVRVHEVGALAARLTGVRVLEATMPRDTAARLLALARRLRVPVRYDPAALDSAYSHRAEITHVSKVRRFARRKQVALASHRSQLNGTGRLAPVARVATRLPAPVFGLLFGREWFIERH
ncbi:PIG-L family deacetylase [Actinomadura rudentiformis]|uniref:PIG-L family deacetylase n=2 Tax=Actinomadura rudentiformis TaxID=359158 RepID=A0A6H9YUT9_9ACTN|nr:PIG-L family deacetylase [Actinomadura rudentiformis]